MYDVLLLVVWKGSGYSRLQKSCNQQAVQWKATIDFTTYESDYLSTSFLLQLVFPQSGKSLQPDSMQVNQTPSSSAWEGLVPRLRACNLVPWPRGRRKSLLVLTACACTTIQRKTWESIYIGKLSVKLICMLPLYFCIMERYSHLPVELPSTRTQKCFLLATN